MQKFSEILKYKRITLSWPRDHILGSFVRKKEKKRTSSAKCSRLADRSRKIKENKKIDKYLDFVRELQKLWTMKVTVILIVFLPSTTLTQGLEKRLGGFLIGGKLGQSRLQHCWNRSEY